MKAVYFLFFFLGMLGSSAQCPFAVSESVFHVTSCTPCDGGITVSPTTGTPPYTYSWAVIGATTATVTGLCPGSYTVTITDAVNCTITDTVEVFNLIMNINTTIASPILCNGQSNGSLTTSVTGAGPFTYLWSPSGGTNATESGLASGCYVVTVTDVNGCTKTDSECLFQPPPLNLFASGNTAHCGMCDGDAGAIAGGGTTPYSYLWSNAVTGQTTTGLCAGNYIITVTDNNGCTNADTIVIGDQPGPSSLASVFSPASCSSCCDGTLDVNGTGGTSPYTYNWQPGAITTASASGLCTGTYTVCITDANGCTSCDTIFLPFIVGEEEWNIENDLIIFPNPASGLLYLQMNGPNIDLEDFGIMDTGGRMIKKGMLDVSGTTVISIKDLAPGFYFLRVTQDGKVKTAFFIVS